MLKTLANLIGLIVVALLVEFAIAEEPHDEHMHQGVAKDVDALHAVLAPLWHAQSGKERSQVVCAKANKLESLAKDIRAGDTKALLLAIAALEKQCQAGQTDIDAALSDVHEAFHRLAEAKNQ
jgi:hypothetical protein